MGRRTALAGAIVVAIFLAHAFYLECVAEDAFITFRFARNLVEGHGLVWNPGEAPVEGYTNFLWLLLCAAAIALGLDPGGVAQAVGLVASLVTLFYTYRCGRDLLGWQPAWALLPCLLLALSGPFATWAVAGLETNVFGSWLLMAVYHLARHWQRGARSELFACFGALLLAMLTRPEGWFVTPLLLVLALLLGPGRPREQLSALAAPAGLALGLFAIYFAWRWSYFGQLLPNTFHAKTGGGSGQWARGVGYLLYFLLHYGLPWAPLVALALLPPAGERLRAGSAAWLRERALLATCAALLGAWAAYVVWVGGDYMAMYRFFVPVLPFAALLLGAAARQAGAAPARAPRPRRALVGGALAVGLLGTLFHSTPLEALVLEQPPRMHGNWRGVQTERWHVARLSAIGRFFADYAEPGESLGTDAIGAISWYSGLRVYGKHGLVDSRLASLPGGRVARGWAGHDSGSWSYLFSKQPTFLMFGRHLRPQRPRRGLLPPVAADLAGEYEMVSVWLEDPENGEAGWFTFLARRDRPARRNGV